MIALLGLLATLVAPSAALAGDEPEHPFQLPKIADRIHLGQRRNILKPIHVEAHPSRDKPVVVTLLDLYQQDQRLANLFSKEGVSEICGPTSLANVLLYYRNRAKPTFPKILEGALKPQFSNDDFVEAVFKLGGCDKESGMGAPAVLLSARRAMDPGRYPHKATYSLGIFAEDRAEKKPPQPDDLRAALKGGHVAVALFGWYAVKWQVQKKAWEYQREGGHWVALCGHVEADPHAFYVTNPLVNYKGAPHSKLALEAIPDRKDLVAPQGLKGLWQTRDLVGGALGVLEDLVAVYPD
jgi:hypothetical protein